MGDVSLDSIQTFGVENLKSTESQGVLAPPGLDREVKKPSSWLLFFGLLTAVTMCSSAGTIFLLIPEVPPLMRAAWRLHAQTIVQLVPFVIQYIQYLKNKPAIISKWRQNLHYMVFSGFFLGLHFGTWVWSLDHTTLAHSLMWVTMYPIFLNGGQWVLYGTIVVFIMKLKVAFCKSCCLKLLQERYFDSRESLSRLRPTFLETAGSIIGLAGGLVMLGDVENTNAGEARPIDANHSAFGKPLASATAKKVTVEGDMMALAGAATMCVYLLVGKSLRTWAPIWLYMTPVAFSAACTCTIASLLLEDATFEALTPTSVFGFFSLAYIGYAFYLGGGAGVGGHTLVNTLLRYLSPLLVSTALLMEPLVGSLIGAIAGVQGIPGIYTFLGGPIVICGLMMIVYGESRKDDENDNLKRSKEANAQETCGTKSTI